MTFFGKATVSTRNLLALGMLLPSLMLMTCADHNTHSFRVEGLELVTRQVNEQCMPSGEGPEIVSGKMDIRFADAYMVYPKLVNHLPPKQQAGEKSQGFITYHMENNHMYLTGVTLNYTVNSTDPLGAALAKFLPTDYFVNLSGYIPVGAETEVPLEVPAIPTELGQNIRASKILAEMFASVEILVHMTFEAVLLDNSVVYSNDYVFPLRVCNTCMLMVPPDPEYDCCAQEIEESDIPCRFGQDEPVQCKACCTQFAYDSTLCNYVTLD